MLAAVNSGGTRLQGARNWITGLPKLNIEVIVMSRRTVGRRIGLDILNQQCSINLNKFCHCLCAQQQMSGLPTDAVLW